MFKKVKVEDAAGMVLCHDITEIVPGQRKGPRFRKGHVIGEEDIPQLLNLGKEQIYIYEVVPGFIHENDAACRLAKLAAGDAENLELSAPSEGRIDIVAKGDGVVKIDIPALTQINSLGMITMATLHNNRPVRKGEKLAGTRVIPLVIEEAKIEAAEKIASETGPVIKLLPYKKMKAKVIVTGNEVKKGRIKDAFAPVLKEKLAGYECDVLPPEFVGDEVADISRAIKTTVDEGAGIVLVTGGMSVDPDDVTPQAISSVGAEVVSYGVPVLPGTMLLLAYLGDVPIVGLPGCVMYCRTTAFDLILPRLLTGEKIPSQDLYALGHGGLCSSCDECKFPYCALGKG